jgi:SET domain-containing protein
MAKKFIRIYMYESKKTGHVVLCADDARFYNHSKTPNTTGVDLPGIDSEQADMATRDIQKGEEITYDYEEGDAAYAQKFL